MNILIIGSGGREHALAWKIRQSTYCESLYVAPGNAGTALCGENIDINVTDFNAIHSFCVSRQVDMIVVGPEEPLVRGIYDYFEEKKKSDQGWKGIVIGPSATGAQLEGSKAFSKKFMEKYGIPTAGYAEFTQQNYAEGRTYLSSHSLPIVLKADGLAAGKGVVICTTHEEALNVFEEMIVNKQFGEASAKVVVEEFLQGIEVSVFVVTDGHNYKIIGHAKDYKRIGEGDTGPNTGGMGCVSPVPFVDEAFLSLVEKTIIQPTIQGLKQEQIDYKGFVFFGLMNNLQGKPYVIEYNCRMGDPETEVVLPRLKNDLVTLLSSLHNGSLDSIDIELSPTCYCTVVAVSGGYPGNYVKGKEISGLTLDGQPDSMVFHAGTTGQNGKVVTSGGRVLAVTSFGDNIKQAVDKSNAILSQISFDGMNYRKDIGYEF